MIMKIRASVDPDPAAAAHALAKRDEDKRRTKQLTPSAKILKMALTVSLISSTGRSSPPLPFAASKLATSPSISDTRLLMRDCCPCRLAIKVDTSSRAHSPPAHSSASRRIESISAEDMRLRRQSLGWEEEEGEEGKGGGK